ncbi:MAG: Curli production assembly/transport component CsgG [Fibrobacterota bacterium]|jgi:TolB-like protein/antitoxin (DNA-binding transcriptional repressor) of toxin-antitoxin stability system
MTVSSFFRRGFAPLYLCVSLLGPLASATLAQSQGTAALLPLTGKQITQDEADILTDALINELSKTGAFQMMERSQMEQILKEQGFQQSGSCDAGQCAMEMGRLLGIQKMLTGSVGRLGDTYVLSTRMVDVKSGTILKSSSRKVKGSISDCLEELLPGAAKELAQGEVKITEKPKPVAKPAPVPETPKAVSSTTATKSSPEPESKPDTPSKTRIWPWVVGGTVVAGGAAAAVLLLTGNKKTKTTAATTTDPGTTNTPATVQLDAGWEVIP